MAALSTFAELMARASATVFSQLCNNALEKAAAQQQQQQNGVSFPSLLGPLLAIPPPPPAASISPVIPQQKVSTQKSTTENPPKGGNKNNGQQHEKRKKRKRLATNPEEEENEGAGQNPVREEGGESTCQQPLLAVPVLDHRQPSSSPLSGSRISSPDSTSAHKARKLKLYAAEEKTDIIDYAKCIGNRAAGREFNVAESSIREWRKNEEKIRRQAETTIGCTQHFERQRPDIVAEIDAELVRMLNGRDKRCPSWYGIAEQANVLWGDVAKKDGSGLEGAEMKITMGWVARFMRRNEHLVPKIAPPIIATAANVGTGNGAGSSGLASSSSTSCSSTSSPSMVLRRTILDSLEPELRTTMAKGGRNKSKRADNSRAVEKKQKMVEKTEPTEGTAENGKEEIGRIMAPSRRKQFRPMRVDADCATLLTTTNSQRMECGEVKKEVEMQ